MLLNCCAREDSRVPQTARRLNQLILKEINLNFHWKDWYLGWSFNTLATWCKELTRWTKSWCWEKLKAGEGGDRGWDGWMASPMQWTWVWVNSESWWWTGRPVMLQSTGSQRVGHNWSDFSTHTHYKVSRRKCKTFSEPWVKQWPKQVRLLKLPKATRPWKKKMDVTGSHQN